MTTPTKYDDNDEPIGDDEPEWADERDWQPGDDDPENPHGHAMPDWEAALYETEDGGDLGAMGIDLTRMPDGTHCLICEP